jgi:hypothetical protein
LNPNVIANHCIRHNIVWKWTVLFYICKMCWIL